MPRLQMGSFGHFKLKGGAFCLHMASVLEMLISSPNIDLDSFSSL